MDVTGTALRGLSRTLLCSCLLIGVGASGAVAQELRIGFLAPTTGIFAEAGNEMVDGFRMYLNEHDNKLGGTKVRFIVEDTVGKPDTAVVKARKLILHDKVHIMVGGLLASTGYALAPVSTAEKTVYLSSVAAADDLTQRELGKYPYFVRTGYASSQPSHPFGQWACEQGIKTVATIGADYAFGYEVIGGFQKSFEACGGKVIQKIWTPIGTKDFGPYIPSIDQSGDAIYTLMVGPMSLQFPKQLHNAGVRKRIIGGGTSYDEFLLQSMGDDVIGHVSALPYSAAIETPKNEAFVKSFRAAHGKVPSYFGETNYTTAQMIDEVMKKNGGNFPQAAEFVKQLVATEVDAVRGKVSFDGYRNPVQDIYIKKVEKKTMFGYGKAELWNTVIQTYRQVSQFGQFNPDEFLKQPVYSRDYPPCKHCK